MRYARNLSIALPSLFLEPAQPGVETLRIQFHVVLQQRPQHVAATVEPVRDQALAEELEQVALHRFLAIFTALVFFCDCDEAVEALVHILCKTLDVIDAAVMGQVQLLRVLRHDPVDRLVRFRRLEMGRRGGREDELALFGIQLPIGKTETVARKNTTGLRIMQAVMVQRVALGMQRPNLAAAETEAVFVAGFDDATCVYRHDIAVKLESLFLAVNALRADDELRRVRHVRRTARVYHAAGIG